MSESVATFIERFYGLSLVVVGLSHICQPRLWADFFLLLKRTGTAAVIIPMFTFPVGLLIVLGHNVWVADVAVLVTIAGWGMMFKSVTYALIPGHADRMVPDGPRANRMYVYGGIAAVVLGAVILYQGFGFGPT